MWCNYLLRRFLNLTILLALISFIIAIFSIDVSAAVFTGNARCEHDIHYVKRIDATCTTKGMKAHYECSNCHKMYTSKKNVRKQKPVSSRKLIIKKKKHKYKKLVSEQFLKSSATYTKKAVYYYACSSCKAQSNKTYSYGKPLKLKLPDWAKGRIVAHAAGGIGKITYSNSAEALQKTLKKNIKCIEMDFMWTSDHHLVCAHDFTAFDTGLPTLDRFLSWLYKGKYSTLSAEAALRILSNAKDVYLIPDTKENDPVSVYAEIKRLLTEIGKPDYMDKVIPQIYNESQYDDYRNVYPFKDGIFTLYKTKNLTDDNLRSIASYCHDKHLTAAINHRLLTSARAKLFKSYGVVVAVHTVNNAKTWKTLLKKGASVVYTDFLY